jgi:hypothetical protein
VTAFTVGGEQRYAAGRLAWAALLGSEPGELPAHRNWPQLLAVLRRVLRWLEQPELAAVSDYLRLSMARDLLQLVSGDLAFAGIPTRFGSSPDSTWGDLEEVLGELLIIIGADVRVPH